LLELLLCATLLIPAGAFLASVQRDGPEETVSWRRPSDPGEFQIGESGECIRSVTRETLGMANVLFGVHHKTGTVMAEQVSGCLRQHHPELKIHLQEHFVGENEIVNYSKVVHFVRNPFSLVVSSYLYHREVGEEKDLSVGSAKRKIDNRFMATFDVKALEDETYQHFLQRVPEEIGLHAELHRFIKANPLKSNLSHGHELLQVEAAHKRCLSHSRRCIEVCMESFLRDTATFEQAWYRVLLHLGICLPAEEERPLRECLRAADVNSPDFEGKVRHVTATTRSRENLAQLQNLVRSLDAASQRSKASKLESTLMCT